MTGFLKQFFAGAQGGATSAPLSGPALALIPLFSYRGVHIDIPSPSEPGFVSRFRSWRPTVVAGAKRTAGR